MNNSVFGKTQENLRKRVNVELITDANILRKRVAKPNFCSGMPITDCLTVIQTVQFMLDLQYWSCQSFICTTSITTI